MNITPKSTSEIQMIAVSVVDSQVKVCDAKRENLEDKLAANAMTCGANAIAITTLVEAVATLTATVDPMAATVVVHTADVATLKTKVEVLKGRPGLWIAGATVLSTTIGVTVPAVIQWFSK